MPSKLSQQIVAMVLFHVGVRSNTEDRHGAAVNVDALLSPANPASISDSARRAAEEVYREMFKLGGLDHESVIDGITAIISKHFAAAPADNDAESED